MGAKDIGKFSAQGVAIWKENSRNKDATKTSN